MDALELALAAREELERRLREERLRVYNQPHLGQKRHLKHVQAHKCRKRILAVLGGNRTGKTVFGSVRDVLFLLGRSAEPYIQDWCDEDKEWWYSFFYDRCYPIEAWLCAESWDIQRDILQKEFFRWLPAGEIDRLVHRAKDVVDYVRLKNGSYVTFKSYESGPKAFAGKALDYAHYDEEPPEEVWEEGRMRIMDRLGYVTFTFTPLNGLSWSYHSLYLNKAGDKEVECVHFTWDDNPYLQEAEKRRLLADMGEDEVAARVYGEYITPGGTVFRRQPLLERRVELSTDPPPVRYYCFEGGEFRECRKEEAVLQCYRLPEEGKYYVIGADVAEGLPSGDNSVACVGDADTGEQVAELCARVDPDTFAAYLNALGRWYGCAELVVERNNTGQAVLLALDRTYLYPALYRHEDGRLGWPETSRTRPLVISLAQAMARDHPETILSAELVEECLTFVRSPTGRPEALNKGKKGGCRDDRVFAWALMLAGRELFGPPLDAVLPRRRLKKDGFRHHSLDEDEDLVGAYVDFDPTVWVED